MFFDAGCAACGVRPGPVCRSCETLLVRHPGRVPIAGLDACRVHYLFDDRFRSLIAALKYRRQRRIAGWLASAAVDLLPIAADAICWVPATPERRRSRGFDQAQELARELSKLTAVPVRRLLSRHAGDHRQTGQDRAGRLTGPGLDAAAASPAFVVVVDDVVTTGSSLRAASETLRNAGANRVVGLALAATPSRRDVSLRS